MRNAQKLFLSVLVRIQSDRQCHAGSNSNSDWLSVQRVIVRIKNTIEIDSRGGAGNAEVNKDKII
jgi:hypothetical protein